MTLCAKPSVVLVVVGATAAPVLVKPCALKNAGALTLAVGILANEATTAWVNLENTTTSPMIFVHVTGTINYTVFQTPANIFDDYTQDINDSEFYLNLGAPITDLTTKTTDTLANGNPSCRAVLLRVNSFTAGATITFYVNSAGGGY